MFNFLLRGQRRKDLQRDDSEDNLCAQKDMLLNKRSVLGSACCYLFSFLSKENKSKNKLCVLRVYPVAPEDGTGASRANPPKADKAGGEKYSLTHPNSKAGAIPPCGKV